MSFDSMQARHMAHDIIITSLLAILDEKQKSALDKNVQEIFTAFNEAALQKPELSQGLADAKGHASELLKIKIS